MYEIEKQFKNLDQLIKVFKWFLIILLLVVAFTELQKYSSCWSVTCFGSFFNHIGSITTKAIPLLTALLATIVAHRRIAYTSKIEITTKRLKLLK